MAQEKAAPVGPRPSVTAARTTEKIAVDGRLSEADWSRALPAKEFLQRDPDEGKPATEATEVRFLYDDKAIYVGARMFDSEPSKIMKRLTRRDGDADGMADYILVGFDALHDHLTGSIFGVTAAGSVLDGVMFNDSSDDDTWNGVWESAVSIDEKGWIAEMRIPFSQLRFTPSQRHVWGLHIVRSIQRKNEESWWALVRKDDNGVISLAGELSGLDALCAWPGNAEVSDDRVVASLDPGPERRAVQGIGSCRFRTCTYKNALRPQMPCDRCATATSSTCRPV